MSMHHTNSSCNHHNDMNTSTVPSLCVCVCCWSAKDSWKHKLPETTLREQQGICSQASQTPPQCMCSLTSSSPREYSSSTGPPTGVLDSALLQGGGRPTATITQKRAHGSTGYTTVCVVETLCSLVIQYTHTLQVACLLTAPVGNYQPAATKKH